MTNATTISRFITLGLLAALTGVIWTIALAQQPSLFA
jgi:hypothetical protein